MAADVFRWIYAHVHDDLIVASISGGTDIIGCFVGGNHLSPVYAGECQCAMLGMDMHACDDQQRSIYDACGELTCRRPFPSMVDQCEWL